MDEPLTDADDDALGPVADLPGIVAFDALRSQRGFRLIQFFVSMRDPLARDAFRRDAEACMTAHGLSEREAMLVRTRDFDGMLEYGASVYAIGKVSQLLGTDLVGIGAASRGQSREAFIAGRLAGVRR